MPEPSNQGNKDRRAADRTPAEVTDFLRKFLETPGETMNSFAEKEGVNRKTAFRWTSGKSIPEGRNGLSKDDQEKLDKRISSPARRDAAYVTGFLQEFSTSGMSMNAFAKKKGVNRSVASDWARGSSILGGRGGLTENEQLQLDYHVLGRSRRNAQAGSSVVHDSYGGDQQDPAYGPPGLSQAGASAVNPYLVSGMPTTTDSTHQLQDHEQNYEPGYPSAPYSWGQPTGPDSHQTAPAGDAYPTDAPLPSITTLVPNLAPTPYSSQQNQQHQGYDQYYPEQYYSGAASGPEQPTEPDSHQTAPTRDAPPTNAQFPSITTL
ncbi:hypothetical protein, partial [Streptomyces sp. NPDC048277]|uniref:hypothetical protein n=1 Tax=Streptomyces sp. NPDC048277 TaxID=3155027 RepID=UPI003411C3F3